jgi:hypothetical protein
MAGIAAAGIAAVTTVPSAEPDARAVVRSAGPKSRPRSEGFSGAASTRMMTSSAAGSSTGTLVRDNSSSPQSLIRERSRSPLPDFDGVIGSSFWCVQSLARQVMGLSKCRKFETTTASGSSQFSFRRDAKGR